MLAGPPKSPADIVANPSPNNVLCTPGSLKKSFPTTAPLVVMSPICSINTTKAIGASAITPVKVNLGNAVIVSQAPVGKPIQLAS